MKASELLFRAAERRERGEWVSAIDYSPATENERERAFIFLRRFVPRGDVGRFLDKATKTHVLMTLRQAADCAAREGE